MINTAHDNGVRVVLSVTQMNYDSGATQASLFGSASAKSRFCNELVTTLREHRADGVNLDFEPVYAAQRAGYTAFVRGVKSCLVNAGVGNRLTVATMAGAASWSTGYDLVGLTANGAADAIFVMGYDFHWANSAYAGGVAPMRSSQTIDTVRALADHLELIPATKIIWGVPYYGREWSTQNDQVNSRTTTQRTSVAYYYTGHRSRAATYGREWAATNEVPWYRWNQDGIYMQGYYDDEISLGRKWDLIRSRGLRGTGMWTLGMDAGRSEISNALASRFADATTPRLSAASPTSGSSTLPVRPTFTLRFSEPVFGHAAAVRLHDVDNNASVSINISNAGNTLTVTPKVNLRGGTRYELRVSTTLTDRYGNRLGSAWTGSYRTAATISRLAGSDRYATAAAVSKASFAPGVPIAYVAVGSNFPDALTGGPAAAVGGGPLLLTRRGDIPPAIASELTRLRPGRIVVLGGPGVVGDGVLAQLRNYTAGGVTRLAGTDRYATAAALSRATFGPRVAVAYIAVGNNFPDALSGSAAAGDDAGPMLLVNPGSIPSATRGELQRLLPQRIVVLGGSGVVSDTVLGQLRGYTAGGVTRLAGADRYATSVAISRASFSAATKVVYLAVGTNFPDALAGAVPAGMAPGPLLLTPSDKLDSRVVTELQRMPDARVVLLGGGSVLHDRIIGHIQALGR